MDELIDGRRSSAGGSEPDRVSSVEALLEESRLYQERFPGVLRKYAYRFDGAGNYAEKDWDLAEEKEGGATGREFNWYHIELPKVDHKLSKNAQYLIDVLCPPLKLQEILSLVSNGPYCGEVDQALVFRVNSPGPAASDFTLRLAVRVTARSVVSVSLGRIPRMGFSRSRVSLLKEVPTVGGGEANGGAASGGTVIEEHLLEFLLRMDHSEEADNPVPATASNLLVHVIDAYVDHVHDIITNLEMQLDAVELELDKGGFNAKKQMLEDRRFPKMHLNLQRLLQVVAHGEQVFPRVKEKLANKSWFAPEDIVSLEELIGRLRRLKENVGFIVNRVNAIQAGLDSWQAEQINRKLYYLSFLSMIFLPLSIVTGVFGMNVGGVPWTAQKTSELGNGFQNVILISAGILLFLVACFTFPALYARISAWRRRRTQRRRFSLGRKSFLRRSANSSPTAGRGYVRI